MISITLEDGNEYPLEKGNRVLNVPLAAGGRRTFAMRAGESLADFERYVRDVVAGRKQVGKQTQPVRACWNFLLSPVIELCSPRRNHTHCGVRGRGAGHIWRRVGTFGQLSAWQARGQEAAAFRIPTSVYGSCVCSGHSCSQMVE